MSSSKNSQMRIRMLYVDNSERLYTITLGDSINETATYNAVVANAKTRIVAFNQAAADTTSNVAKTFISNSGARVEEITEAEIVTTEEEEIYNG